MLLNLSSVLDSWKIPMSTRKRSFWKVIFLFVVATLFLKSFPRLGSVPQVEFLFTQTVPYKVFFDGMENYAIDAKSLKDNYKVDKADSLGIDQTTKLLTKDYLKEILNIDPQTLKKLKKSHHGYVNVHMEHLIKDVKIDTFGKQRKTHPSWRDYSKSKGYVIIGGGPYSWLSYLVVKQIRATGSILPIEVFIPSQKEYEPEYCEEILPRYNARCIVLDPEIGALVLKVVKIGGYQFKMLAILQSSFENVMYMDSDLFPVKNPEHLFTSQLFEEKGLFLWPDAWARTTNPYFHDIAEHPVIEKKVRYSDIDRKLANDQSLLPELLLYTFQNSNFHDFEGSLPDPTSEAGILVVNKTSHKRTLLLALYYNLFGPKFYYPLLTQGSAGEGDKETFIAAATVMNETYFHTPKLFKWIGYESVDEGKFVSKSLGHYDPLTAKPEEESSLLFMHCSYPKYYTDWFYSNHDLVYKDEKTHIRMYESVYENVGYDVDLRLLLAFVIGVCKNLNKDKENDQWAGNFLSYIGKDVEVNNKRCEEVYIPHLEWLKETTKYKNTLLY